MSLNIENKLGMSLDDIAKAQHHRGGGDRNNRSGGKVRAQKSTAKAGSAQPYPSKAVRGLATVILFLYANRRSSPFSLLPSHSLSLLFSPAPVISYVMLVWVCVCVCVLHCVG